MASRINYVAARHVGELCIFEIQNEPIKLTLIASKTIENQPVVLSLEWQNLNLVTSDSSGTITTWKYDSEGEINEKSDVTFILF